MDLNSLLNPRSIAVVGASNDVSKIGGRLYNNLIRHGYTGEIYPVNPKYDSIGESKCYPSLNRIDHPIDSVLVAVPGKSVSGVLEEAGKNNVKSAIVFSSGFSEVGEEGAKRQELLAAIAREYEISVCGPNNVGIINFHDRIAMSFSQFLNADRLIPGSIAFISQSGALGGSILNRAQDRKIGFSYFISTGNEAVLDSSDFMEYLIGNTNTKVVIALLEGIRNFEKFFQVAYLAFERNIPIVVMKIGRTETGGKAASSHTGSMTGSDEIYDTVFRQKGVIRVDELDDLYLTASAFVKSRMPKGNRIGILTSTGGGGVILTDKIIEAGMKVPEPSPATLNKLRDLVPPFVSVRNPFDLTAQLINDPLLFPKTIETFAEDENFDAVIAATSMVAGKNSVDRASFLIEAAKTIGKPVFTWWAAGSLSAPGKELLEESQVPFFTNADQCVNALQSLLRYAQFRKRQAPGLENGISIKPEYMRRIERIIESSSDVLTEDQGREILNLYGIPVAAGKMCKDLAEVKQVAENIGYPVALKIVSPQIKHKAEMHALKLSIRNQTELGCAYEEILDNCKNNAPQAELKGVLVQEMVRPGKEVIVGVSQDQQAGPVVLFGLGGIFVEVLRDYSLRCAPLVEDDAWEMIRETKGFQALKGVRGERPSDLEGIVKILVNVSKLAMDLRHLISEIDINPLIVHPQGEGAEVVDCLFVCNRQG
jgi:acetyltransferase